MADGTVDMAAVSGCIKMALKFSNVELAKMFEDPVTWGEPPSSSPPSLFTFTRHTTEHINHVSLEYMGCLYYPDIFDARTGRIITYLSGAARGKYIPVIDKYMDMLMETSSTADGPQYRNLLKEGYILAINSACDGGNLSTTKHVYHRIRSDKLLFDILFEDIESVVKGVFTVTVTCRKVPMLRRRKAVKCAQWVLYQLKVYQEKLNYAVIHKIINPE
jgi:hypothetical protein